MGITPSQLKVLANHHSKLEEKLENTKELAAATHQKVLHLRKAKRMWYKKIKRAIAHSIDSIEELEHIKHKESKATAAIMATKPIPGIPALNWDVVFSDGSHMPETEANQWDRALASIT